MHRPLVAVCERNRVVAVAVVDHGGIIDVRRAYRYHKNCDAPALVRQAVLDYGASRVVVESTHHAIGDPSLVPYSVLPLARAKETLLGRQGGTHRDLLRHLVTRFPRLANIARVLAGTGGVAMSERWRTAPLYAVALGLAELHRASPPHS